MLIVEDFQCMNYNCKIVRDDLFPFPGGGNKARKAIEYEKVFIEGGYNAIVTTGGIQSNHCRAMAILATRNNWHCHLVYQGSQSRFEAEKGNALLVRKTCATMEFVGSDGTSDAMDGAMERYREAGLKPYYVTGGGHDIAGGLAYVKATQELKRYCDAVGWKPDVIFLASGTGSTQVGILVGLHQMGWDEVKVFGISVARKQDRGLNVMHDFMKTLEGYLNLSDDFDDRLFFRDDFLCGGYEMKSPQMEKWLDEIMFQTGVYFDTTYSGKALWGMYHILNTVDTYKNVLFWHTGGLMNLLK